MGETAFRRLQAASLLPLSPESRTALYARLANEVSEQGVPGSSAGGEQAKFLATLPHGHGRREVLVKFSPRVIDDSTRRIADLLRCEHHALTCLHRAGIPAANSEVIESDGRVFLEVERFDRTPEGRIGLVSLLAVAAHHGAEILNWAVAANDLLRSGVVTESSVSRIVWLDRFGELIGNTDRHLGNLSFFFHNGAVDELAPVYDMLPMAYALRGGEFTTRPLTPPMPTPHRAESWHEVWAAATEFWRVIAADLAIRDELRAVARVNETTLRAQAHLLNRLPGARQRPLFA